MIKIIKRLRDRLTLALLFGGAAWFTLGTAYDFEQYGLPASLTASAMLLAIFGLNALGIVINALKREESN